MHSAMSLRYVRLGSVLMMEKSLFNLVPKDSWIPSNIHCTACTKRAKYSATWRSTKNGILAFETKTLALRPPLWTKRVWTEFMPSCLDLCSHNEDCVWKPLCFCYRLAPWLRKTVVDACYVGYVFSVCFVMLSVTNKKTHFNLGTKWIDGDPGRSLFGVDVIFF